MPGSKVSTKQRRDSKAGRPKHSKRYLALAKQVNPDEFLDFDSALAKIKELAAKDVTATFYSKPIQFRIVAAPPATQPTTKPTTPPVKK